MVKYNLNANAAFIAAKNYLYVTRVGPGGRNTQAGRVLPAMDNQAAAYLADRYGTTASHADYTKGLIEYEDTVAGAGVLRPIRMGEPDLTKMSASELHHKANVDAANRARGGK